MINKFSIVTPTYNQAAFIKDTLDSIFSQEGNFDLEYLIFDGGSTDGTIDIIKKYSKLYNSKNFKPKTKSFSFYWWSGHDGGQSEALTQGYRIAKGNILGWLNSDDIYNSRFSLKTIDTAFKKNPRADIIVGNSQHIDVNKKIINQRYSILNTVSGPIKKNNLQQIERINIISQPSTFFKKELLQKCPLDQNLHYSMDWDLWIKAYKKNKKFIKINKYISSERTQPEAKTVKHQDKMYQEWLKVYHKHNLWPIERFVFYKKVYMNYLKNLIKTA